jgi:hypothetical protein
MGKRVTDPALRSLSAEAPPPWPEYDEAGLVYSGAAEKEAVPNLTEFTLEIALTNSKSENVPMTLLYEFQTTPSEGWGFSGVGLKGNIGFRCDFVRGWGGAPEEVLPLQIHNSHLQVRRLPHPWSWHPPADCCSLTVPSLTDGTLRATAAARARRLQAGGELRQHALHHEEQGAPVRAARGAGLGAPERRCQPRGEGGR